MDLSWVAGIMEGEGSFFLARRQRKARNTYVYPKVSVEMCDEDVIQTIKCVLGSGNVTTSTRNKNRNEGWKISYKLTWEGSSAVKIMELLLPLMHSRRSNKIKEVLRINEDERARAKANFKATRATYIPNHRKV